jgi:hypothetical protein
MRGDSIRDLYAKTLALFGLGILAGTGALVDYWPSRVTLPVVESALALPDVAHSLPVPANPPEFAIRVARQSPREVAPALPVAAVAVHVAPRLPVVDLTSLESPLLVSTAALSDPPAAALVLTEAFAAESDDTVLGQELRLSEPAPSWPGPIAISASLQPVGTGLDEDRDGLIAGAVKRTGTTLARTGRKTGSSIIEAFRVVTGAMRKALPN